MTDGSRQLADIADDLEAVKAEMDERGSSMTDGTPLVNIRKSLARMKQEVVTMDVRVGVVQHTLLQAKLKVPFIYYVSTFRERGVQKYNFLLTFTTFHKMGGD